MCLCFACGQAELRDCQMTLTAEELKKISFGPKIVEFGHVSVLSDNKKCFSLQNNLPQSVLVEIKVADKCKELAGSGPASQVVPSGAVAGFVIAFAPSEVQDFNERVSYTVNGKHTFNFTVTADVGPIVCELRPAALFFEFASDSTDMEISRSTTIVNTSNAVARCVGCS
jgi:hypothetical protein